LQHFNGHLIDPFGKISCQPCAQPSANLFSQSSGAGGFLM